MSSSKRILGIGVVSAVAMVVLAFAPAAGATGLSTDAKTFPFPSSTSTIVGSIGFINSCEVGYFWSASRGDGVSQVFQGPKSSQHAILDLDVVENALSSGNQLDWNVLINSKVVGGFIVDSGFTGAIHLDLKYAKIKGKPYTVALRVTNEIPSGGGSITLSYADCGGPHEITIKKK